MSVSPVSAGASQGSNSLNNLSPEELSQQFLTMMVAQMKNQDPTNPMDNNQMVSQLAQFNMASGVANLNTTMQTVGGIVANMQTMNAGDWVGRTIMIKGDPSISDTEGQQVFGLANASSSNIDTVTATFTDKEGNVYTQTLKNVEPGVQRFNINDIKDKTSPALDMDKGPFKVTFSAQNDNGDKPEITALKATKVNAVSFVGGSAVMDLGPDGTANLSDIYSVE